MIPKEILKHVRHIEFGTRKMINSVMAGAYHSSFKGNGMEFAEVREYIPGDDVRTIDWNVTARTGKPFVKQFVEERELTVMLLVDASASGIFGSGAFLKSEVMATLSALLAFAAVRNNDKVGLMIFTEEVELHIPPAKGRKHVLRILREILCFKPKGKGTNIKGALEETLKVLKRKAVVVLMSDFFAPAFDAPLRILQKKHEFLAIGVEDPRERELPNVGLVELADAESGETFLVDTGSAKVRDEFAKRAARREKERSKTFSRLGVDFVPVVIAEDYRRTAAPLLQYFSRRALK